MDALATFEQIAEPKLTSMEDLPKSAPKGKSVGNCEVEETETSQHVPLGTINTFVEIEASYLAKTSKKSAQKFLKQDSTKTKNKIKNPQNAKNRKSKK